MSEIKSELLGLLHRCDLMGAALFAGRVHNPSFQGGQYVDSLLELAAQVWHRCARCKYDSLKKAEAINHVLYKVQGFQGKSEK